VPKPLEKRQKTLRYLRNLHEILRLLIGESLQEHDTQQEMWMHGGGDKYLPMRNQ
jgi:hypothetical protein